MMDYKQTREFVICACNHLDHLVVLNAGMDEKRLDVSMDIHLSPLPWWKRISHAFWYVLGRRSRYGDFEEIMLGREQLYSISKFCDDCLKDGRLQ